MDSIKNAIVTITLLAVGYGSYIVLQDEVPRGRQGEGALSVTPADEVAASGIDIEVGTDLNSMPQETVGLSPTVNSVSDTSPLPPNPFDAPPATASDVAPPVAGRSVSPEEVLLESPVAAEPADGPFGNPVVVPADPVAGLDPDAGAAVAKIDTATVEAEPSGLPAMNSALGPIPPANASEGSLDFERAWTDAQNDLRNQQVVTALAILSPWTNDETLNQEQRERLLQLCDQLAGSIVYSREHHLEPEHVVQAGETLEQIASALGIPQELLAKINGIAPPYALSTGETLKVVRGPFRAEISMNRKELVLFLDKFYAGRFPMMIGPDLPPEESIYEVAEKANGRSYFDRRSGNEVTLGDARNRYGNHWLGLRGEHITTGHSVGLHGRPLQFEPEDLGSVSLDPLDAEDVYSILSVGSQVLVRP